MTGFIVERRRSGWDVAVGLGLVVGGVIVLGHAALATAVSVLFLGWLCLAAGIAALAASLFSIGLGSFWSTAVTGALLFVLGLVLVRHPGAAAVTLTLIAGALFLTGGLVRLVLAADRVGPRAALLVSGAVSVLLGLIVLLDLVDASTTLLGVLLAVQLISDGIVLLAFGRVRTTPWTGPPDVLAGRAPAPDRR